MGAKRKVTKALYSKIKGECKSPKNDIKVMKKYGLGKTTVCAIRNSFSFDHFVDKTSKKKPVEDTPNYPIYYEQLTTSERIGVFFTWMAIIFVLALFFGLIAWALLSAWGIIK